MSSLTRWINPRRSKVSIVPLSSVHTSHPLYPEFPPRLRLVRSSTGRRGLRPHSMDSAEPPYTVLSQHDCTADIHEAYEVHLRYGLCACALPRSGSRATFVRRCSRVSVTFHAYAIATQATNQLLRQDFHLQDPEQLAMRSERNVFVGDVRGAPAAAGRR